MTQHDIAAPLASALASKDYAKLTSVQDAVLADNARARDLLVSAQTGSGKTVAFGLAMAPDILAGATRLEPAERPLALAIAPTRELALQVARELTWLYAETGAQIATCVGGMDYRTERRALARGPHIVVGTPGRLRDHIERGGLDLGDLRAAVLDEADEMLDLGFREDLEFILQAAPAERRTLMFSATVPPAIEKLARDFQHDALRIVAAGEARQHGDIEYRAINVTLRDREPAVFNLLRLHEARMAIVFCKTRANVNHLLSRMANRGFKAVALSGELSQQERTHALQALRDGRARVCVATDVAARGIDLPGLELVIHADLPTNAETLLHRSGRTGRAGAKGVSALIVTPADQKKAQRLLKTAKLEAQWQAAPTADDVQAQDDARILSHPALTEEPGDEAALADQLLDQFGPQQLAAAFIRLWRDGRPAPEDLTALSSDRAPAPIKPRAQLDFGDAAWFSLSVGHTGRAEARWLLPKICEAGGITRDSIGAIRVRQDETFVQIAAAEAPRFADTTELEPGLTMRRLAAAPDLDRPAPPRAKPRAAAPARPARERKPAAHREWSPADQPATAEAPADRPRKQRWSADDRKARAAKDSGKPKSQKPANDAPKAKAPAKPKGDRAPQGRALKTGKGGWAKPRARVKPKGKPGRKG